MGGMSSRFSSAEVDSLGAEGRSAGLLWCVAEDILSPGDLEVLETDLGYEGLKLCIQQSAGDSAGPQGYILLGFIRHRLLHRDIRYLEPAPRL